jgi:hypothetical protein
MESQSFKKRLLSRPKKTETCVDAFRDYVASILWFILKNQTLAVVSIKDQSLMATPFWWRYWYMAAT